MEKLQTQAQKGFRWHSLKHALTASLSLDLDNKWSYMKVHGDPAWQSFPSYLDLVVPRVLDFLAERKLKITVFIVGQDAAIQANHSSLGSISQAGHEIGNHSFNHDPWLHLYTEEAIFEELAKAEEAIEKATGSKPTGFRGPGFSLSNATLSVLSKRGYSYDASTLPTFLGPLARTYYFWASRNLSSEEKKQRAILFGRFSEGFKPVTPYRWHVGERSLIEIPVTTMPIFKIPFHLSYILYLATFSASLARFYFKTSLDLCALMNVEPSLLLHPLDFLGCDDQQKELSFFPAMKMPYTKKIELVGQMIDLYTKKFEVLPVGAHVERIAKHRAIPIRFFGKNFL